MSLLTSPTHRLRRMFLEIKMAPARAASCAWDITAYAGCETTRGTPSPSCVNRLAEPARQTGENAKEKVKACIVGRGWRILGLIPHHIEAHRVCMTEWLYSDAGELRPAENGRR